MSHELPPAQERARKLILDRVATECDLVAVEAEARTLTALDRWALMHRCRRSDIRPEVEEAIVGEVKAWALDQVKRIASEAVARMRSVGLDAEDLLARLSRGSR